MTTRMVAGWLLSVLCLCAAVSVPAATPMMSPASWLQADSEGSAYFSISEEGFVQVAFSRIYGQPVQSASTLVPDAIGNAFTGDYIQAGARSVSFNIRSELTVQRPVGVMLVLQGKTSGRVWRYEKLSIGTEEGQWSSHVALLERSAGWTRGGGGDEEAMWAEDIADVGMIGLRFDQNGKEAKIYSIQGFSLLDENGTIAAGASLVPDRALDFFRRVYGITDANQITDEMKNKDTDGDGMNDWDETWAGTDPEDANSVFAAEIEDDPAVEGIIISWPCVTNGRYTLLRCTDLMVGFSPLVAGLIPTPQQAQARVMTYVDATATGEGPYFYKVFKE